MTSSANPSVSLATCELCIPSGRQPPVTRPNGQRRV